VRPLEFARGRILAELETSESSGAVVDRLGAALGDGIEVRALGMDGETLLLAVAPRPVAEPALPTDTPIGASTDPAAAPSAR
jgi:hypothetical protein